MKKKRILITGASGLVGANCVQYYLDEGYDVRILLRKNSVVVNNLQVRCEVVYGDLTNKAEVHQAVNGCNWVLHAASQVHSTGISMKTYIDTNYEGTKNIVDACIDHKIEKLVYISTASIVNGGTKKDPATELNDFELVHLNSGYLYSKYLAHQYVVEQAAKRNLNAIILSPGFVLGALDSKPSSGKLLLHANQKRILICPPGRKCYVHVKNVVQAVNAAFLKGNKGAHYLVCNEGLSYRKFYEKVNLLAGQRSWILTIPKWLLLTMGLCGSLISVLTKRNIALTYEAAYMLCIENYYSNKKSIGELGIQYDHTEKAIVDSLTWFKEQGYWKTTDRPAKTLIRDEVCA